MNCSNCSGLFRPETEGLVVTAAGERAVGICPQCCKDVRVAKIAVRNDGDGFKYVQWHPLEMMSGGITTPRRAG